MPAQPRPNDMKPTLRVVRNRQEAAGVTPPEIAAVIHDLAARIKADGNADLLGGWAVATLASKLGVAVALSSSTNPAEVVRDLGEDWADAISRALDDHPARTVQLLRAAAKVIEQMAADAKARGLAG